MGGMPGHDGHPTQLPLAALLIEGRLRQSLSLNDVAVRVRLAAKAEGQNAATNKKTVSRWEHGEIPRPDSLRWLSSALGIPLERAVAAAHVQKPAVQPNRARSTC
jgi:transcriptional regulator with XRE-family HTH domain